MKILAIDPGPTESAWIIWDGIRIHDFGKHPNDAVLEVVHACKQGVGCAFAVEMIASYGMAVGAEVFETCVWIGRFIQAWGEFTEPLRVKRLDIKMHHCHDSKAKDTNIRAALIDRLGTPGTKKQPGPTHGVSKDVWAALALAVCVGDRMGLDKAKRSTA